LELDGVSLFAGLDDAALAELVGKAVRRRFAAGQVLCREGEPCTTVFVIISGLAQVRTGGVEVNLMRHGDVVGELGISAVGHGLPPSRPLSRPRSSSWTDW
jgi:CRP-like cAMP-binding protein